MWMLITAISEHVKEVSIILGGMLAVGTFAVKMTKSAIASTEKAIKEHVTNGTLDLREGQETLRAGLVLLDAKIGRNGRAGATVHDVIGELKDSIARIESKPDQGQPSWFMTPDYEPIEVNAAYTRLFGWSLLDLQHGGWRSSLDEQGREAWDDVTKTMTIYIGPMTVTSLDGKKRTIQTTIRPVFTMSGKMVGWRAIFDDRIAMHAQEGAA